ncbi:unnamed protein product, partial [Ectocarpus sp. 13 AM-2016]
LLCFSRNGSLRCLTSLTPPTPPWERAAVVVPFPFSRLLSVRFISCALSCRQMSNSIESSPDFYPSVASLCGCRVMRSSPNQAPPCVTHFTPVVPCLCIRRPNESKILESP